MVASTMGPPKAAPTPMSFWAELRPKTTATKVTALSAQKDIGVGAALGGPMVLATISYAVVGFAMLWNSGRLGRTSQIIECDSNRLRHDQAWFLSIFVVKVVLGLLVFRYKAW